MKQSLVSPESGGLYIVTTESKEVLDFLSCNEVIAFDIETDGLSPFYNKLAGFSIANAKESYYVPCNHKFIENMPESEYVTILKELLNKKVVGHNLKFDYKFIYYKFGIDFEIYADTYIYAALVNSERIGSKGKLGLKTLSGELLDINMVKLDEVSSEKDFTIATVEQCLEYACADAFVTFKLFVYLNNIVNKLSLNSSKYFPNGVVGIEHSIVKYIAKMELLGVLVDDRLADSIVQQLQSKVNELEKSIRSFIKESVDLNSPKQLSAALYDDLGIPMIKNSRSTDKKILAMLVDKHPVVNMLLEYSKISTLIDNFFGKVNSITAEDGRIHTEFNQMGARSGRFSSSGGVGREGQPIRVNLQNMPKAKEKDEFNFRKIIIPSEGYYWLHADYSQVEYRTLASMAGEQELIEAYHNGTDFHSKTASMMLNIPVNKIDSTARNKGKTLNFAICYGMNEYGLAHSLNIEVKESKMLLEEYFKNLSGIKDFRDETYVFAVENSYVKTFFGRIRRLGKYPEDSKEAIKYLRSAFNTVIQGTAADLVKIGLYKAFKAIESSGLDIKPVLTVHDELNFEVNKEIPVNVAAKLIYDAMTINMEDFGVKGWTKFLVDCSVGTSFGQTFDIEDFETEVYFEEWFNKNKAEMLDPSLKKTKLKKPCIILGGQITTKKARDLYDITSRNYGEYRIYIKLENGNYCLVDKRINPIPQVLNSLKKIGLTIEYNSEEKNVDIDKLIGELS